MKKIIFVFRAVLLLLCAVLLIACVYEVNQTPDSLQYAVLPPANDISPQKWLSSLNALSPEMESSVSKWQLSAVFEDVSVLSESGQRAQATVFGFSGANPSFMPVQLISGRAFTEEEIEGGENVIYIDQNLSHALFKTTDVQGLTVYAAGQPHSVIGVVAHRNAPGEKNTYHAYLPYQRLETLSLSPDALVVTASPIPGAGANAAFSYAVRTWMLGGTEISLKKEKTAATLWPRMLVFALGIAICLKFIRMLNMGVRAIWNEYEKRLKCRYAVSLLPIFVPVGLLLLAGYAGTFFLIFHLLNFVIRPVYIFTEFVPESLVKWSQIKETFRTAVQNSSGALSVRTQAYLHIRFLAGAIRVLTALTGVFLASFHMRFIDNRLSK